MESPSQPPTQTPNFPPSASMQPTQAPIVKKSHTKFSIPAIFLLIILVLFCPIPYFQTEAVVCKMGQVCPNPGWHTNPPLYRSVLSYVQKRTFVSSALQQNIDSTPPGTQPADPTTLWKLYTDTVLGIEYKLPVNFGMMERPNGNEVPGDTGTQYCQSFIQSISFIRPVFAGYGACGGGDITIGSVSKDYSAGREGGFADHTGYVTQDGKYYPRFIHTVSKTYLPPSVVSEHTNVHGVTYLKIYGINTWQDYGGEQMYLPILGTPGEGYVGALVNLHENDRYYGFNIHMKLTKQTTEDIFDTMLSTLRLTQKDTVKQEGASPATDAN